MSQIDTIPLSQDMASTEVLPFPVDFTAILGIGETITSPISVLMDTSSNTPYTAGLLGNPTISGNVVTQIITSLVPKHTYSLLITVVITGKSTTWTTRTVVNCVV